ncbi:MAG: DNA repair protein RecO [Tenericutes bacterium GWE2_38_8]|nr:MAG: DNA repair protein RecO [Tenericutes bacterium GWE2_38_8]HCB66933.1 DNA repair protein RecO [Acholeplasmataceae bacterium]
MEGLIYKVQPYQESARLLFVYTPEGKRTLLAQGSQKINNMTRVLSQYLTHIEFKDQKKSFMTLSEPKLLHDFEEMKKDYQKTKSAAVILEIIDQLVVDDYSHALVFQEMMLALLSPNVSISALSFALKILKPLGYEVNLTGDGRKVIGVNIEKGGLVYQGETDIIDLDTKEAITLLKLYYMPYQELSDLEIGSLTPIQNFILKYYQYHLQTTIKNLQ